MENTKDDLFFRISQWCLMVLAFLYPLWFLPTTAAPVEFNKAFLVPLLVFLAFILYLVQSIKNGKISVFYHWLWVILGALVLAWLISAFVAGFPQALWGGGVSSNDFFDVFVFVLLVLMVVLLFGETPDMERLFLAFASGLFLFILSVWIFSVFGMGKFIGGFFGARSFNTMGSWNSAGFIAAFFAITIYPFLVSFRGKFLAVAYVLFALGLLLALYVNNTLPLIILGVFGLLLLSYAIWKRLLRSSALIIPVLFILIAAFGYVFSGSLANLFNFPAPSEVSVSPVTSWKVAAESLKINLLFGRGPTSFGYLWDQFKPSEINGTIFWGTRFSSGFSHFFTLLAEIGFLPWLLFAAFLVLLWFFNIKAISQTKENEAANRMAFVSFLMLSFTILVWSMYSPNYSLIGLGFWAISFSAASLRSAGLLKKYDIFLFSEGPKGFISALLVVFFIIIGISGLYAAAARYVGEVAFASALNSFNVSGDINAAENNLLLALRADRSNDAYFRTLSSLYMVRAQLALQDKTTPQDLLGSRFKDALDKGISAAQGAIAVSPYDFQNFENFGKVYALLAQLNTEGAAEAALSQYDEALKRAPKNPLLWTDEAAVYMTQFAVKKDNQFLKKAEDALLKAVDLKPDYAEGHFLLAQIYDAEGRTSEAIDRGKAAALLSPRDIGAFFQLGLLYYRSNQLSQAEAAFGQALSINTNYSNARYFLGLVYDRTSRKPQAISEFEKIANLNPDNDEVKKILANLRAGKAALAGITPPSIAPEKRNEPPIKEGGAGGAPSAARKRK